MTSASDFRDGYSPGGMSAKARKRYLARHNGRKGGLAAGVTRRQLARGRRVPHARTRDQALALAYQHHHLTRVSFDVLYERVYPCPERGTALSGWERGRETLWLHYRATFKLYRAAGQHARTTNGQRGAALHSLGRPRCRRTIQRLNRKLEALGLAVVSHYKDQRDRPGHKDCLVIEIRSPRILHVTPPLRGSSQRPFGPELGAGASRREQKCEAGTASAPPTSSADDQRPAEPAYTTHRERGSCDSDRPGAPRGGAPQESLYDFVAAAIAAGARQQAVHGDVRPGGGHDERVRGGVGLHEVQGRVPPADGQPAAQPRRPEDAQGVLRGDEVGGRGAGGDDQSQLDAQLSLALEYLKLHGRGRPATPGPGHAPPPQRD